MLNGHNLRRLTNDVEHVEHSIIKELFQIKILLELKTIRTLIKENIEENNNQKCNCCNPDCSYTKLISKYNRLKRNVIDME